MEINKDIIFYALSDGITTSSYFDDEIESDIKTCEFGELKFINIDIAEETVIRVEAENILYTDKNKMVSFLESDGTIIFEMLLVNSYIIVYELEDGSIKASFRKYGIDVLTNNIIEEKYPLYRYKAEDIIIEKKKVTIGDIYVKPSPIANWIKLMRVNSPNKEMFAIDALRVINELEILSPIFKDEDFKYIYIAGELYEFVDFVEMGMRLKIIPKFDYQEEEARELITIRYTTITRQMPAIVGEDVIFIDGEVLIQNGEVIGDSYDIEPIIRPESSFNEAIMYKYKTVIDECNLVNRLIEAKRSSGFDSLHIYEKAIKVLKKIQRDYNKMNKKLKADFGSSDVTFMSYFHGKAYEISKDLIKDSIKSIDANIDNIKENINSPISSKDNKKPSTKKKITTKKKTSTMKNK